MSFENIVFQVDQGVATITFNRPKALNALNQALLAELSQALDAVAADESIRVLILTGAGEKSFCSGAFLDEVADRSFKGTPFEDLTDTLDRLASVADDRTASRAAGLKARIEEFSAKITLVGQVKAGRPGPRGGARRSSGSPPRRTCRRARNRSRRASRTRRTRRGALPRIRCG